MSPNSVHERIQSNEDCWIIQTYLYLKNFGVPVSISPRFMADTICIASSLDYGIRDVGINSFVVACRSDGFQPALADVTIVQNPGMVANPTQYFIPHWPQPGLIRRDKSRQTRIENIAFKGSEVNLYESFKSKHFADNLSQLGVKLCISGRPSTGPVRWHDYSSDDLVLAVRDLTAEDAKVKPASKLVNAWHAGVPALLGPEPAFRDLRRTADDYFEVKTPDDVINTVKSLKADPERYLSVIRNGEERAKEFTAERVRDRWVEVLLGPVTDRYEAWLRRSLARKVANFPLRCIRQKINIKIANWNRFHGHRTISATRL